jgi:trk system potassium uptake protein
LDKRRSDSLLARRKASEGILVAGLGRFGRALASTLAELGEEVLALDQDPKTVQELSGRITRAVQADSTDVEALRQLGVQDLSRAVVAIGTDVEASILTTAALVDLGVESIWAKAVTGAHARILRRVGAHHVVLPEHDAGVRVAHVVAGRMMDYLELDPGFVLAETTPPEIIVGRPLSESRVRARFGVTVVCIKPAGRSFTYATPETVVSALDVLVIAGEVDAVEAFAKLERPRNVHDI